jgi:hypothetical protein
MKTSALVMGVLAVLAWSSSNALAQGKGKEGDDGKSVKVRDAKAGQSQGGQGEKQTGPQGKKAGQTSEEVDQAKGKGKGQEKQAGAFQKQQRHELAKHMEQQARLNRIREIAVKKGDAEMIARVDKLIAKEQEVYNRKFGRLQGQPRASAGLEKAVKAPGGPNDLPALKVGTAPNAQKGKSGTGGDEGKKELKDTPAVPKQGKK